MARQAALAAVAAAAAVLPHGRTLLLVAAAALAAAGVQRLLPLPPQQLLALLQRLLLRLVAGVRQQWLLHQRLPRRVQLPLPLLLAAGGLPLPLQRVLACTLPPVQGHTRLAPRVLLLCQATLLLVPLLPLPTARQDGRSQGRPLLTVATAPRQATHLKASPSSTHLQLAMAATLALNRNLEATRQLLLVVVGAPRLSLPASLGSHLLSEGASMGPHRRQATAAATAKRVKADAPLLLSFCYPPPSLLTWHVFLPLAPLSCCACRRPLLLPPCPLLKSRKRLRVASTEHAKHEGARRYNEGVGARLGAATNKGKETSRAEGGYTI